MKVKDVVDFKKIKDRLSRQKNRKEARWISSRLAPKGNPDLSQILWEINCQKYIEASNEEMVSYLYNRLVRVHELERGMLPVIYAINKNFKKENSFYLIPNGSYHSEDIITFQSCTGHLVGEPQTGKNMGTIKYPFIAFVPEAEKNKRFNDLWNLCKKTEYHHKKYDEKAHAVGVIARRTVFTGDVRQFWHDVIDLINEYNRESILDHDLAEVIRP